MKSYAPAVAFIAFALIMAHLLVGEPYVWSRHSISQLAAQGYANAWMMRMGFIGFGCLVLIAGIGRIRDARRYWHRETAIMLYGLAILFTGVFSTVPFVEGVAYSLQEARLHSFLATAAGAALSIGILLFAVSDEPKPRRLVHGIGLLLVIGLSFLFGVLPTISGVIQRLLWAAGFAWLIYLGSSATFSPPTGRSH